MDIIILPSRLADEPDLPAINQCLLTGEATLDWGQVKQASLESAYVFYSQILTLSNTVT